MPAKSVPLYSPIILYGIFLSPGLYSSKASSAFFGLKWTLNKSFAKTSVAGIPVYGLKVLTLTYFIPGPTQSAVFDGKVQGVVVQAKNETSVSVPSNRNS